MVTKTQGIAVLAAAVLGIALNGCTAHPPTQTAEPQPSESSPSEPAFTPLADGDCDNLLSSPDVAAALGGSQDVDDYFTGDGLPQLSIVGGLRCHWAYGEQGSPDFTTAFLDVVPAAIAEEGEIESAAATICEQGSSDLMNTNNGCLVDGHTNGWWYELKVVTFTTVDEQSAASRAIDGMVQTALAGQTPPGRIAALPAVDCAAAAPGAISSQTPMTADQGAPAVAADRLARPTTCEFSVDDVPWYATVFPGTTTAFDLCPSRAGGQPVTVPGVADAFAPPYDGVLYICTTDGTSSVAINRGDDDRQTVEWTDALLATAGTLAAPLLAVASA